MDCEVTVQPARIQGCRPAEPGGVLSQADNIACDCKGHQKAGCKCSCRGLCIVMAACWQPTHLPWLVRLYNECIAWRPSLLQRMCDYHKAVCRQHQNGEAHD